MYFFRFLNMMSPCDLLPLAIASITFGAFTVLPCRKLSSDSFFCSFVPRCVSNLSLVRRAKNPSQFESHGFHSSKSLSDDCLRTNSKPQSAVPRKEVNKQTRSTCATLSLPKGWRQRKGFLKVLEGTFRGWALFNTNTAVRGLPFDKRPAANWMHS